MKGEFFPFIKLSRVFRGGLVLAALAFCMATGCDTSRPPAVGPGKLISEETAVSEPTFAAQAAAVREGKGDRIQVEMRPVTDDDLKSLAGLDRLEVLLLDHPGNRITSAGLVTLAELPKLMHVRLRGVAIDDEAAAALAKAPALKILNIPQSNLTDAGLAKLTELESLVQLRVGSSQLTDEGLQALGKFPNLSRVHLIDIPIGDAGLAVFETMPKLESLYVDGGKASDDAYGKLFKAKPDLHVHVDQAHHDRDPKPHEH